MKSLLISQKSIVALLAAIVCVFTLHSPIEAQTEITGPWLWMIVPIHEGRGGAESTNVDSLAVVSGGAVTEADVAVNGATEGDVVGNYTWTLGVLNEYGDIEQLLYEIGMIENRYIDNASSYALITLVSETDQPGVTMHTGSDDSIKVWLNGENVFTNAVNRGRYRWQDNFQVNLKKGNNLLLVKISEAGGGWGMHVGIGAEVTLKVPTRTDNTTVPSQPVMEEPEYVYWADFISGKIQRSYLDGSNVQDVITDLERPIGITIDSTNGQLYWNDTNGVSTIKRANLDGTNIELLLTGDQSLKEGMALDLSAGKMYWIHQISPLSMHQTIQRANLDGSNIETLVSNIENGRGIALDTSSGKMYWTDVNRIQRANLDGTDVEDLANVPGFLTFLALDIDNQHMYWANHWQYESTTSQRIPNSGKIQRANLDGSNLQDLVEGLQYPGGITLDLRNGKMYWTNLSSGGSPGSIQRANLDGSNVETIVSGLQRPVGIALSIAPDIMPLVEATVGLSPAPSESPVVGEQLMLNLNIAGGENITGYQATVQFDETVLRYVSSANADFLPADPYITQPIITGNSVTVAAASYVGETNGDGTLVTLTFDVISERVSTLTLTEVLFSNSDGMLTRPHLDPAELTITPKPAYPAWDVNEDGNVNILDLVLVGQNIGGSITAIPRADVNADGSINILDLVLVAGHFGETTNAAAPDSVVKLEGVDPALVEKWLELAQFENDGSSVFRQGIVNLERLLASLIPHETALLANYPNPFNPETWMPYQLAKPAEVSISIYAADGKLIRTLALGHQAAGVYHNRSRAAYWDGKNAVGESVASGVYFYTLIAGDFTATRKMLILK